MQGLIIHSSIGGALSSDEITAAHRVANTHKEMRAGVIRQVDAVTGATVEYHAHKRMALTTPGTGFDYVKVMLPNPVPYRGVSIGVVEMGNPSVSKVSSESTASPATFTTNYSFKNSTGAEVATITSHISYTLTEGGGSGNPVTMTNILYNQSGVVDMGFVGSGAFVKNQMQLWGLGPISTDPWAIASIVFNGGGANPTTLISSGTISPSYEETLSADHAAATGGVSTYVVASNGEVLAREIVVETVEGNPAYSVQRYLPNASDYDIKWSGGGHVDMFEERGFQATLPREIFNHKLTFEVPEDCIYPVIDRAPAYPVLIVSPSGDQMYAQVQVHVVNGTQSTCNYYVPLPIGSVALGVGTMPIGGDPFSLPAYVTAWNTLSSLPWVNIPDMARWGADWVAGQTAQKLRRKNWFKKNHETVLTQLKAGTLPDRWGYALKVSVPDSSCVFRKVSMSESYEDAPVSDTSNNLSAAGVKVTKRTATLSYTIPVAQEDGSVLDESRESTTEGFLTQTVTDHLDKNGNHAAYSRLDTYTNWYVRSGQDGAPSGMETTHPHQFLADNTQLGMGLFWSGSYQAAGGYFADSTFLAPGNPLTGAIYTPPLPAYSDTLAGSAPDFVLKYHLDSKIEYRKDQTNTFADRRWISSAPDRMTITLTPFSPVKNGESLGMFWDSVSLDPDNTGTKTFDSLRIFGSAQFHYVYATGEILFDRWIPLTDSDGNVIESRSVAVSGAEPSFNCIVKYGKLIWPDVIKAGKEHVKAIKEGDITKEADAILIKAILDAG